MLALPRLILLEAFAVQEESQLFVVAFLSPPGRVAEILGHGTEYARPSRRLHDRHLFRDGIAVKRSGIVVAALLRFVRGELQVHIYI